MPRTIVLKGADVYKIKLNKDKVEFKPEVKAEMKKLGYAYYNKYTLNGMMFTSHEQDFMEAQAKKDLYEVELVEDFILDAEGKPTEKLGLTVINCVTKSEMRAQKEFDTEMGIMDAKLAIFTVDNLKANPELFNQLNLIGQIANKSA